MKSYPEKFKVLQKIGELDSVKMINPAYVVEFNPSWGYFGDIVDGKREGKVMKTVRMELDLKVNIITIYLMVMGYILILIMMYLLKEFGKMVY